MNRFTLICLFVAASLHAQTVLVKPFVQPGDGASLTGTDVKVLTWVTDQTPGTFTVEYNWQGGTAKTAAPVRTALDFEKVAESRRFSPAPNQSPLNDAATTLDELAGGIIATFPPIKETEQHYFRYRAVLPGLPFDTEVGYRVRLGTTVVREAAFKTRASASKSVKFVAVGDMAANTKEQRPIAFQIAQQKPDFLVAVGDIVYPGGRALQYMNHFFPCYNDVEKADMRIGAPLMATVPIYPVIGNHDADVQRFPKYVDAYSAFYWFSVPKNGPGIGPWSLPLGSDAQLAARFKEAAGDEYPAMSDYSFDYGPAHFIVIDANKYAAAETAKLAPWIEKDLKASKQAWKFVFFHQPAFHTSKEHYSEQRMRLLEPVFEKGGVDVVFAGHVHNYQRTKPLKFTPNPPEANSRGRVNGDVVLDETFDGVKDTTPEGIIHIVTGGGGARLYSVDLEKTVAELKKSYADNYKPLTAKYVASTHSFSVIELTPKSFELRQIAVDGAEVDRFRITK